MTITGPGPVPVPTPDEPIRRDTPAHAQAGCSLPGCGKALHFVTVTSRAVYLSDTTESLASPDGWHTSDWYVECEGGHRIASSIDSARDTYVFGACQEHDDGEGHPVEGYWFCEAYDIDRLRAVVARKPILP